MLTVRDLLYWVKFIEETKAFLGSECAFIHGAFLVLLDGLSLGTGLSKRNAEVLRADALSFILEELKESGNILIDSHLSKLENYGWGEATKLMHDISSNDDKTFGINSFYITKGQNVCKSEGFEFQAPTTCKNALRVLRAMQLPKPVLLEGSPVVGKTSLIIALAEYSGHEVVRINLSEQTDMMDLLGSDLPVEGENGMAFAWSDGILLQALQKGSWVLLDELNLAPQSVLEAITQNMKIQQPSKLVWMDGDLIKSIDCGDWVVLDNANLCNPTILDRINSLVESDGSITVNECSLVDGKPVKLVAHYKFRMFLTMDPKHGEVSRAMRNRGLEIFMMQPKWFGGRGIHDSDSGEINDVSKFLILSGIPFNRLILAMSEANTYAKNAGSHLGVHITLLELSRWVQLFQQLLMNGNQLRWSLQLSWEHAYVSSLGEAAGMDTVEQAKLSWLSDINQMKC